MSEMLEKDDIAVSKHIEDLLKNPGVWEMAAEKLIDAKKDNPAHTITMMVRDVIMDDLQDTFGKAIHYTDIVDSKLEKCERPAVGVDPDNEYFVTIPFDVKRDGSLALPKPSIIGDVIRKKFRFARIKDDPNYLLHEENRVFTPNGHTVLEKILAVSLGELWTSAVQNEVTKYIKSQCTIPRSEFDKNRNFLNCKNTFVDLDTIKAIPQGDIVSLAQIDAEFRPELARSELFEGMAEKSLDDDGPVRLFEVAGSALTRQELNPMKIIILLGPRGSGKSTILKGIANVFGKAVSHKPIQMLQHDKFTLIHLENKYLNVCADLPEKPLEDFDVLKGITTKGEEQPVQEKIHPQHDTDIFAVLLCSCNTLPELPKLEDDSIIDRLMVIKAENRQKANTERVKQLETEEEKSRILNTLIYYVNQVRKNKERTDGAELLTKPQSIDDVVEIWKNNSDGITRFINTLIRPQEDIESPATVQVVFSSYVKFCALNNLAVEQNNKFNKVMERYGFWSYVTRINDKSVKCWGGCTLLKTADEQTADHEQSRIGPK